MYHVPGVRHFLISIHALRKEGDRRVARTRGRQKKFLSTPSARRATGGVGLAGLS